MKTEKSRIEHLHALCMAGLSTDAERDEMFGLMALPENEDLAKTLLAKSFELDKVTVDISELKQEAILQAIYQAENHVQQPPKSFRLWTKIAAAAAILLVLSTAIYFILPERQSTQIAGTDGHDIKPGTNGAILTLANGKKIVLENLKDGVIAEDNGNLKKTGDSALVYQTTSGEAANEAKNNYNKLETPKGRQYSVVLPDGSKVWLNTASSLTYPTAFVGKERLVRLTGEAYFEVAYNKNLPFKVVTRAQTVEVLGTHFNINSYNDESAVKTTLIQGSVMVSMAQDELKLKPGQQALATDNPGKTTLSLNRNPDLTEVIAWKNGLFEFNNASIADVLKIAARWYDLTIVYEKQVPDIKVSGRISRNVNFSGLKNILEYGGLKLRIEGQKLYVLN